MFLRWSTPTLAKQVVPMSAFTPPADFEVYPVEPVVAEDGRTVRARFEGKVGDLKALADHLKVEADTTPMPIGSVRTKGRDTLEITLSEAIQKGQQVRFSYDGKAALSVDGKAVPQIIRYAQNDSAHRLTTKWAQAGPKPAARVPAPAARPLEVAEPQRALAVRRREEGPAAAGGQGPRRAISSLPGGVPALRHRAARGPHVVPRPSPCPRTGRSALRKAAAQAELRRGRQRAEVWVNGKKVAEHQADTTSSAPTSPRR